MVDREPFWWPMAEPPAGPYFEFINAADTIAWLLSDVDEVSADA